MKNQKEYLIIIMLFTILFSFTNIVAKNYNSISVLVGESSSKIEKNIADLLIKRFVENGIKNIRVYNEKNKDPESYEDLIILIGVQENHSLIKKKLTKHRINKLSLLNPGKEGFLLKLVNDEESSTLVIAGIDERGCLYGVGEILRKAHFKNGNISIDENMHITSAPAFEIRGTQYGQSHVAKRISKVRSWTTEETERVILDYALSGANIFNTSAGKMFNFIKSYGLMTQGGFGANTANSNIPDEWKAAESIGRLGYVCLSVPEARKYMLNKCEEYFKNSPTFDLIKFHGGDGGGCECDKCNPYGLTFIKLVEEMADIIHKYHPTSRVYFTNQKFDNDDDIAIFNYLNEKPREWLWAWGYGPGSDATTWQPGHRQTHRMDLFNYPGFGPYDLYPKEIIRRMPYRHSLVYYNEITHWKYAQHAYIQMYPRADKNGNLPPHWSHEIYERRPDQYLTMVYNRLTFYAWPKYYHRVFNDLMRYGIGDITHSSGHHDHFNQWMWQRLLWSPRTSINDAVDEYCKYWFGNRAAPYMTRALFLLEENIEEKEGTPLDKKDGIKKYFDLVKEAGNLIPKEKMTNFWLWSMYMQKGILDRYTQLNVINQKKLQRDIESNVTKVIEKYDKNAIDKMIKDIDNLSESYEMTQLKEKAKKMGEESDRLFGVRNDGFFNLNHDFIGLGWLKRQLKRAMISNNPISELEMIRNYENVGEGSYYDNLGTFNKAPHVIFGYPYDHGQPYVKQMLSEENRPSQRSMHFTQDESNGVTLYYNDLDKNSKYKIRFTLVRPWYQDRYRMRMSQKSETIYADDKIIVEDLEIPEQMSDFFTFDIPESATNDGELTIKLKKSDNVANGDRVSIEQWRNSGGWGTIVSEVWLIKE